MTVLYRKYRPQTFGEIIGQTHVAQTLSNAIATNSISHAYLFTGPRGSGKTTFARVFAKAINCQNRKDGQFEPCDKCSSCLEIVGGNAMDLIEIDAASHTGVDDIRELIEGIKFTPVKSKYKVFIVDECLTSGHLVNMADGRVKKISEIKNGDKILSADIGTGNIVEGTVSNWFERKTNKLLEIKTPQARLKVTPAHKIWVLRDGKFLLLEAKELKTGDFLLSPNILPHVAKNNLTPEYLSLLALIQCDGHVSKDSITVQIEIRKDKNYFPQIVKNGLKAWDINERPVITKTLRGTRLIRVYSAKLKEGLIGFGCPEGKKGSKIDIPDEVFQAPLESIRAYIDTCFCCEGNVDFDKKLNLYRLHFNSTSEVFVKKLQILLKKFGIASKFIVVHKERHNKNHSPQYRITLSHNDTGIFFQKIGLSLNRKNKLLEKGVLEKIKTDTIPIMDIIISKREENKIPYSILTPFGIWLDKEKEPSRTAVANFIQISALTELNRYLNFRYEKIKEIKVLDKEEYVYDFTVEGMHTFIVNGICSSNCHQLSKSAANALLKTLEEPPAHAVFVLATTEIHKMIPTIISRCQRFDFKRLQVSDIIKKLEYISEKEGIKFDKSALSLIALNARGSFRDAESLMDECLSFSGKTTTIRAEDVENLLGIIEISVISKFIDFLVNKNAKEAVLFINKMVDGGVDLQEFTKTLIFYLRQALLLKINPDFIKPEISGLSPEEITKIKVQIAKLTEREIQNIIEVFIEAENKMKYSSIQQLPLELAIVDITNPQ